MARIKPLFITVSLVYLMSVFVQCLDVHEIQSMSHKLDQMLLGEKNERPSSESGWSSEIQKAYDFGSKEGYREALSIVNITNKINEYLFSEANHYKFFTRNGISYLAASTPLMFVLNVLDNEIFNVTKQHWILLSGKILTFEVFTSLNGTSPAGRDDESDIIVVLSVELAHDTHQLIWYILSGENFQKFWFWPIQVRVGRLLHFRYNDDNRLITMAQTSNLSGSNYSYVDIWGFSINGNLSNFWLSQRLPGSDVIDVKTCPAYNGIMVAVHLHDNISIYDYTNENSKEAYFEASPSEKSVGLKNFACFQSGHILYLGTSGPNGAILDYFEGKFQFHLAIREILNEEIVWIETIPVDTYRDEVLVLVQLKNNSIAGLVWQDNTFERISLPPFDTTDLHLSRITVIPKVGFVYNNRIVIIRTKLEELTPAVYKETEHMFRMKDELAEILRKQNLVFEGTETRLKDSYLTTSVITAHWQITHLKSKYAVVEKGLPYQMISLGQSDLTQADFESNLIETRIAMQELHRQLDLLHSNMNKALSVNSTQVEFPGYLHILGDLTVNKLTVDNISFGTANNSSIAEMFSKLFAYDSNMIISGQKTFPAINATTLNVNFINGIPIDDIIFDKDQISYDLIDFPNLRKLVIIGDLNFTYINDQNWNTLIRNVVSKSKAVRIPGETIINGHVSAIYVHISHLNRLKYPKDYVLKSSTDAIAMPSNKKFKTLTTGSLSNLLTINESPVEEFILLHGNQNLLKKMTFENLEIMGSLQIDANITGGPEIQKSTVLINETRRLMSPAIFAKLKVERNIQVNEEINQKTWPMLHDLVKKNEKRVEITGKKTFQGHVTIKPDVYITNGKINGHRLDEFVTTDTSQDLPNLERIDANVTFGKLTRGDLTRLGTIFSECIMKVMTFKVPPIVVQLTMEKLQGNVSVEDFMTRLNKTSGIVYERMVTQELHVSRLSPENINGMKREDFMSRLISKTKRQQLLGNFEIDNLDAGMLHAERVDGRSVVDLESERKTLDDLYDTIVSGGVPIDNLMVTGVISSERVNDRKLQDIYDPQKMGVVVLHGNVSISELRVKGLFNGRHFSEIVDDAVLKTDRNISVKGLKTMTAIVCEGLTVASWNQHPVETFLNPNDHQVLTGPVVVKGMTTVEKTFDSSKTIGNVTLDDIKRRFVSVSDKKFILNGNFKFPKDVDIQNLLINGSIQSIDFSNLPALFVFLDSESTSITGSKRLKDSVKLNNLTITHRLNENDLQEFYQNVVILDGQFPVKGRVIASGEVIIKGDIIVKGKIDVKTMMGVDVTDLVESAVYLNQPVHIPGTTIFKDIVFASNIKVERLNDLQMDKLLPLHKDKVIDTLHCENISADAIRIEGTVNNEKLEKIYADSFQLTGLQNVTGNFTFLGDVNIRRDLDAPLINGMDPLRFESLEDNGTFAGDLVFKNDVVLNGSLRVLGVYNGINPLTWQALAVTTRFPMTQIISGVWTVDGNVRLKGPVAESGLLNGTNVRKLVDSLRKKNTLLDAVVSNKEKDLQSICKDLELLKDSANDQIYRLKFFDYAQVLEFDRDIVSAHYFEADDSDCLFVSLENCMMMGFVFEGNEFVRGPAIPDFGVIEKWISLDYRGARYFVTIGRRGCGKSPGNLWKLTDKEMVHVMDLGGVRDGRKISDYEFVVLVGNRVLLYSVEGVQGGSGDPKSSHLVKSEDVKLVGNGEGKEVMLLDEEFALHLDLASGAVRTTDNPFGTKNVSSYRFGAFGKEKFVYYDEAISEDYIFIADYEDPSGISQAVRAYRPSSISVMSFGDGVEDFLMYVEGSCRINVHEYKGVEGFVYRETLHIDADKLLTIRLRRDPLFGKVSCLGVIARNTLKILEGMMYGQRIDGETLTCEK
ncbi:uncharacterized protein LOC107043153 [Diachasma alloeum]|uniref:uncharacterized protein LOC107043153 n=1 Tax=Diachasma alloeum TaxID=454923 RepID=UPI0007383835|nr:uncharacterized protein LOC107043153 [Diachasma alloeum]